MVLGKVHSLGLQEYIDLKNTLQNPKFRQDHMDVTGRSTVPCLYIDNKPLFESSDIIDWLDNNQNKIKN